MTNNVLTILISILFFIIISCIIIFIIRRNNKHKMEKYIVDYFIDTEREFTESIILPMINKSNLSKILDESISLDMYMELSKEAISEQFYRKISNNEINNDTIKNIINNNINKSLCVDIVNKFFTISTNYQILAKLFIDKIYGNIQDAEKTEEEYIKYLEQFGEDPEGDPELHPIEITETYKDYDDKTVDINDLHKMGVTEDI